MANLTYAQVIRQDNRYRQLADLGLGMIGFDKAKLMPRLIYCVKADHLPILADSRSLTDWDGYWLAEDDISRRNLIAQAVRLHRGKGTPHAIKLFLKALGMGDVRIHEGGTYKKHDAAIKYRDGFHRRGSSQRWAYYQIEFLNQPISKDKLEQIMRGIDSYAPARCVLTGLKQARGALKHNGRVKRNGQHYRGQIWLI